MLKFLGGQMFLTVKKYIKTVAYINGLENHAGLLKINSKSLMTAVHANCHPGD